MAGPAGSAALWMVRTGCVSQRSKRFGAGCGVVRGGPVGTIRVARWRLRWCCRKVAIVLCQGESGSGASLDARDGEGSQGSGAVPSRNRESDRIVVCSAGVGDVHRLCDEGSEALEGSVDRNGRGERSLRVFPVRWIYCVLSEWSAVLRDQVTVYRLYVRGPRGPLT